MREKFIVAMSVVAAVASYAASSSCPPVTPSRAPRTSVTHHTASLVGGEVPYTAVVGEFPVHSSCHKPGAFVVTISYERDGIADPSKRPVLFAFNGGPGESSLPFNMQSLGPVMLPRPLNRTFFEESNATGPFRNNPYSLLDVSDLVFIDPVSTGFSRALPGADPHYFLEDKHDALEVASVIRQWLKVHHRENSPRYLIGESYGTIRCAAILKYAPTLRFKGVILESGGGALQGRNTDYADLIPPMAAAAWYFKKIDRKGRTVAQVFTEASQFAEGEYVRALDKGTSLPPAARHRMAQRLSELIGLPVSLIESHDLKISRNMFMFNLLKSHGLRTGLLDSRAIGPLVANAAGDIDDPALGVVKSDGKTRPTIAGVGPVASKAAKRYFAQVLNFPSTVPYYLVNFTANAEWKFDMKPEISTYNAFVNESVARAMKDQPALRLLRFAGYFDLGADDGAGFLQAGVPQSRYESVMLPASHQVYRGENGRNRVAFNAAIRSFMEDRTP